MTNAVCSTLVADEWRSRIARHRANLSPWAQDRTARMSARIKHPVDDFLFQYYSFRPAQLLRWSPGADVFLDGATQSDIGWREFEECDGGLLLRSGSFPESRRPFLQWAVDYLEATARRPASFHCLGLHEWAMVYRTSEIRHDSTPLRLPPDEIAKLVDSEGLRCTHFDAVRFFTPLALPLNRVQLTRRDVGLHDQKGCIHVTMDLYRHAYKLAPYSSGELIADTFLLAREARLIDMRASPYDLREYGIEPICIENREGREEYIAFQQHLAHKAEPLRQRLIEEYRRLLPNAECGTRNAE